MKKYSGYSGYVYLGILISTHLLIGLLTYWLGLEASDFNLIYTTQMSRRHDEDWVPPDLPFPEVYSPLYLIELAKYEGFVNYALEDLANQSHLLQVELVQKIDDYMHDYQEEMSSADLDQLLAEDQAVFVAQNPLMSINMIWRFTAELTEIFEQLQEQPYIFRAQEGPGKEFVYDLHAFSRWPNKWTLKDAMIGLFRIQMVHDMDAAELANGILFGHETGPRMSIPLIYELGKFARSEKKYTLAVPWLELALEELIFLEEAQESVELSFNSAQVEIQLQETMMQHDMEWPNRADWQYYFYSDLLMDDNYVPYEDRLAIRKMDFTAFRRKQTEGYQNEVNYWSLCSGDNHQTEEEKSQLFCWYDTKTHPALTIFPIKKELLSKRPFVVQMYDLLSESRIADLLNWAAPKLERSRVVDETSSADSGKQYTPFSSVRTSVDAFVLDENYTYDLAKLTEIVSGLVVVPYHSSEQFLVASYSYGGHYDCHLDAFEDDTTGGEKGNRIATMMFYLENTPAGGFTAFPQAGIAVTPTRGSAVFWYNMKRSGKSDLSTHHCACPVVLGHKTISTKWIRYNSQFQTHPCGLHEEDLYAPIPTF